MVLKTAHCVLRNFSILENIILNKGMRVVRRSAPFIIYLRTFNQSIDWLPDHVRNKYPVFFLCRSTTACDISSTQRHFPRPKRIHQPLASLPRQPLPPPHWLLPPPPRCRSYRKHEHFTTLHHFLSVCDPLCSPLMPTLDDRPKKAALNLLCLAVASPSPPSSPTAHVDRHNGTTAMYCIYPPFTPTTDTSVFFSFTLSYWDYQLPTVYSWAPAALYCLCTLPLCRSTTHILLAGF